MNTVREWRRSGWTWFALSVAASLLSLVTFAVGERDLVAAAVQWSFIAAQAGCIARMVVCFRRANRARREVSR